MARVPRKEQFDPNRIGFYHCYSRCVRGQYLLGSEEEAGGKDEHRKQWIEERQAVLLSVFAMELVGFAILDNHMHHVVRNRPDIAAQWSNEEVVRRWLTIHPIKRGDGTIVELTDELIQAQVQDQEKVAEWRNRLRDLSWFMKELKEPIAKRANAETGKSGPFWNERFKSPQLLDIVAILLCLLYVDLNPIRAKLADRPEQSYYTSAYQRIAGRLQRSQGDDPATAAHPAWPGPDATLTPIPEEGEPDNQTAPQYRATDQGVLPMTLGKYLEMLDWSGRQLRADKRGAIPADLAPLAERLGIREELWLEAVEHFGNPSCRALGRPQAMQAEAERVGRQRCRGISTCRAVLHGSHDQA